MEIKFFPFIYKNNLNLMNIHLNQCRKKETRDCYTAFREIFLPSCSILLFKTRLDTVVGLGFQISKEISVKTSLEKKAI
jgi:hypothetical protein